MLVELTALSAIKYRPGDHIAVFPVNNSADVDFISGRLIFPTGVTADSQIFVETLDDPRGSKSTFIYKYFYYFSIRPRSFL